MKASILLTSGLFAAPYLFSDMTLYHSADSTVAKYLAMCPSLTSRFLSTPWLNLGALQALYGSTPVHLKSDKEAVGHIIYNRELCVFPDGGVYSLDWVHVDSNKILFIVPGLTGGSDAVYIKHITLEGINKGYSVVVMNGRGISGTELVVFIR